MLRITLKQLYYFIATADAKTIAGAAEVANVSQPSISIAIAKLEEALGVDLFVRHHAQGMSLTANGKALLPTARDLIQNAIEFQGVAHSAAMEPVGEIKVGCYSMLAAIYMPAVISEFARLYPRVKVNFVEGTEDSLIPKLKDGEIEQALVYGINVPETLKVIKVGICRPYVLLPADHRLVNCKTIELADLIEEPFILINSPSGRSYYLSLFADKGLEPKIAYSPTSFEVVRGLVARGLGYSVLTTELEVNVTYDGLKLESRALPRSTRPIAVNLIRMPTRRISRIGELFQDVCRSIGDSRAASGRARKRA